MLSVITKPSIARRIFITLVFASIAMWMAFYSQTIIESTTPETGSYDRLLHSYAKIIETIYTEHPDPDELEIALTGLNTMIDVNIEKYNLDKQFLCFSVWSKDGQLLTKSNHSPAIRMGENQQTGFFTLRDNLPVNYFEGIAILHHLAINEKSTAYRVYAKSINHGQIYIQITQAMKSRHESINASALNYEGTIKPFLIGFPIIFIPLLIAVYTGLKPLRYFSQELAQRQPGDLKVLNQPFIYSELEPLIKEFNATLLRLQELLQREREFLADAAHELRTPLALINAQSDALIQAENETDRADASLRLSQGLSRANRLVNQLLALARMETNDVLIMRHIDVCDLIRECLASYSREAKLRKIDLTYHGPDHCLVESPNDALFSVINNLVSNAVHYGDENGHVIVQLTKNNQELQLQISDDGPGIDEKQRESMFKRFHRGTDVTSTGSGLGLAIVISAVRMMNADLKVHAGIGGKGVGFTLVCHITETIST